MLNLIPLVALDVKCRTNWKTVRYLRVWKSNFTRKMFCKKNGFCEMCYNVGHLSINCPKGKACGINGCRGFHKPATHVEYPFRRNQGNFPAKSTSRKIKTIHTSKLRTQARSFPRRRWRLKIDNPAKESKFSDC